VTLESDSTRTRPARPIVELRQYLLHPGRREELIDLFDREFVETQEATGMQVVGQFRDLDRPDRFVWLRAFDTMAARRASLTAFYGGPAWARHRDAANSTMIDTDDVLLLRPASRQLGLLLPDASTRDHTPKRGMVVAAIVHRRPGSECEANASFRTTIVPAFTAGGARTLGLYETEPSENDYLELPVRDANVLVWFGAVDETQTPKTLQRTTTWREAIDMASQLSGRPTDILRLTPTSRSLLDAAAQPPA
jgi:NIPSNAP